MKRKTLFVIFATWIVACIICFWTGCEIKNETNENLMNSENNFSDSQKPEIPEKNTQNESGTTAEKDFEYEITNEEVTIIKWVGEKNQTRVVIPDVIEGKNVTKIGDKAFWKCGQIIDIVLSNNITSIGDFAFANCYGLTNIKIPTKVAFIGDSAFINCCKLVEIYNLSSLNITIDSKENGCVGLYALNVYTPTAGKSKLSVEDDYVFYDDEEIYLLSYLGKDKDLVLPNGHNDDAYGIYQYAFYYNNDITSVVVPEGVTFVGDWAFARCGCLVNIVAKNSSFIGRFAFERTNLVNVELGDNVTSVEDFAFSDCFKLTVITFGTNINFIGESAFARCVNLTRLVWNVENCADAIFSDVNKSMFSDCDKFTSLVFGEKVKIIPTGMFGGCKLLTEIIIPNSVISVNDFAFVNCKNLVRVTIGENLISIGKHAFSNCEKLSNVVMFDGITTINDGAFSECIRLEDIKLPNSVKTIGVAAFSRSGIRSIVLPNKLEVIKSGLFSYCYNLSNVIIPNSVTTIEQDAFLMCFGLVNIEIPTSVKIIEKGAFYDCRKLVEVFNLSSLDISLGARENGCVGYYALNVYDSTKGKSKLTFEHGYRFYVDDNIYLLDYCENKSVLILPNDYKGKSYGIYEYAFFNSDSLKIVTIPQSVNFIGNSAFENCKNLTQVIYYAENADKKTDANDDRGVFAWSNNFSSILIGENVKSLPSGLFAWCGFIEKVYYQGSTEEWAAISIGAANTNLTEATRYYYSETKPEVEGNFWHYNESGEIEEW